MDGPLETLEGELVRDLDDLSDRLGDERLCVELYRSLTNRRLSKKGRLGGHLVLEPRRRRGERATCPRAL